MRPVEPRSKVRLRFTSTVTALERPWLKLWRTCPVSTVFLSCSFPGWFSFNGRLASSDSLLVVISCSAHLRLGAQPCVPEKSRSLAPPPATPRGAAPLVTGQIGRASCREHVCPYV